MTMFGMKGHYATMLCYVMEGSMFVGSLNMGDTVDEIVLGCHQSI